jgi:uncharacterized protein (TIGR03435 family)
MLNHLWQSTVFAGAAWLLTLALRDNRAALRYGIWLAASIKFLIPFSLLVSLGSQIEWRPPAPVVAWPVTVMIDQVARPFQQREEPGHTTHTEHAASKLPVVLFAIWLLGAGASAASWLRQWMRARAIRRSATPRGNVLGVPVFLTSSRIEPGIFGVFRQVLILPAEIETRLAPEQIRAIFAHELAHVRRRDNLTAALHMAVEASFWFHPAVWLIRAKLAEERERACDEAVLHESVEPEVYAEGILNVCKFYLEPRLACVSGVSGANLKKRIEDIMTARVTQLSSAKKALIGLTMAAAIAGPLMIGFVSAPRAMAQSVAFDVASVKPIDGSGRMYYNFEPGRLRAAMPLQALIAIAYDIPLQSKRISGGPDWVRSEGFEVEGKADLPGLTSKARETQMKRMLQALLADRFQLKLQREKKDMPIYTLTVGKNGPKLTPSKIADEKDCPEGRIDNNSCHVINGGMGRGLHAKAADIGDVVLFVANWTDRPLIDNTGLKGLYELDTEGWVPMLPRPQRPDGVPTAEDLAFADPARPTLGMIFDRLGLKMDASRGPVESFIIESAARPAGN